MPQPPHKSDPAGQWAYLSCDTKTSSMNFQLFYSHFQRKLSLALINTFSKVVKTVSGWRFHRFFLSAKLGARAPSASRRGWATWARACRSPGLRGEWCRARRGSGEAPEKKCKWRSWKITQRKASSTYRIKKLLPVKHTSVYVIRHAN